MSDALTEARNMELPAAAVSRVARRAQVGIDDAEVIVARLVLDLREAGWIVERTINTVGAAPPVDPRVARAMAAVARAFLLHLDQWDMSAAEIATLRKQMLTIAEGKIE